MAAKPSVSIVIPNWNGVYLMEKHLGNVIRFSPGAEVIVADDMSTDGSVEWLKKNYPQVTVVTRNKREGFAANVNAGASKATGDVLVLLNTDVEPEQGYLEPLLAPFADPDVFAVGCNEKSREADGSVVMRGRGVAHWEKGYYLHSRGEVDKTDTAWVSGGSGAFRRSMWEKLGGMDTLYNPFYWEDIDLSYRARKAGWKTRFESKSVVGHYHEEGKIKREFSPVDVKRIVYRNQFVFVWKNLSHLPTMVEHVFWTPVRILQAAAHGDRLMFQGYLWALTLLPKIVIARLRQSTLWKVSDREL